MFKSLVAPIQAWLISQGRCGGCGEELKRGSRKIVRGKTTVTCRCGRIFIKKNNHKLYGKYFNGSQEFYAYPVVF